MSGENTCARCGCWIPVCKCDGDHAPAIHCFQPMVYHDICETPILVRSKRQLKEECKRHDVIAARLL